MTNIKPTDFDTTDETNSATRIGKRIRELRLFQGKTQAELGSLVGLTADRIQKYENGVRKPKEDTLIALSLALGVSYHSLSDPLPYTEIGAIRCLLEMEDLYNLTVHSDSDGSLILKFGDGKTGSINHDLSIWKNKHDEINQKIYFSSENEKQKSLEDYRLWKCRYPLVPNASIDNNNEKKERIKQEIEKLQKELSELE